MNAPHDRPTVVIAGATGFIGRALCARLRDDFRVIGLTRDADKAASKYPEVADGWRSCDLFSLTATEAALEDADYAVYLVHSMLPSARLTQAAFDDLDLILADNFARAAAANGVRQITYLGGIIPRSGDLSKHLASRVEVEDALRSHGVPVTVLRAGLVVGAGGSSFRILLRLVQRLPVMLLPAWTQTPTTPVALMDAVELLARVVGRQEFFDRTSDIGSPESLTYRDMIATTAEVLGKPRKLHSIPLMTPKLSALWVSVMTGAPMALVKPLVSSLECPMRADDRWLQEELDYPGMTFRASMETAAANERVEIERPVVAKARETRAKTRASRAVLRRRGDVRSVQRLPRPDGASMAWIAAEYSRWLPRFMFPFIHVREDDDGRLNFYGPLQHSPLLQLTFSPDSSRSDRQVFFVTGGRLADTTDNDRGRLEFRSVLDGQWVLAGIHDFTPRLPWFVYRWTQALAHLWVMAGFGRHLDKVTPARPAQVEDDERRVSPPAT